MLLFSFLLVARAAITYLLFAGGPAAISRLVTPVIIWISVDRLSGWPLSHIGEEMFKSLPSFADLDSAASVVIKILVFGITASFAHRSPASVCRRVRVSMRKVMAGLAPGCECLLEHMFFLQASTTASGAAIWFSEVVT